MRMMHGYKGELFVLYLSFIGWMILSSFTCGLLYVLYVGPYIEMTKAGFCKGQNARAAKISSARRN